MTRTRKQCLDLIQNDMLHNVILVSLLEEQHTHMEVQNGKSGRHINLERAQE
jgi:riboflavin synthase alpha subunit